MRVRLQAMLATGILILPGLAFAQTIPSDVTFEIPLNLTRLASDITQIDITCNIMSDAIVATREIRGVSNAGKLAGHVVLNVATGRLVTTANVVVAVSAASLQEPTGKSATYQCMITGYSVGTGGRLTSSGFPAGWGFFDENSNNPSFRLSPTPQAMTGSFVW